MDMKKLFGFGSGTPSPPPPPSRPPAPPGSKPAVPPAKPASVPVPAIVGRWKERNGSDITEFHSDGTVTEQTAGGESIRGTYLLEGGRLKIKLDGVEDELVFPFSVKPETLEMADPDGQVTHYRRV